MSTDENQDITTLASATESNRVVLLDGTELAIKRMKTRETMALLKVLTRGAGGLLGELNIGPDMEPGEFAGSLLAATVLAIPEAEDETIEFVNRMVEPVGLVEGARLSKPEREINQEILDHLAETLQNPELEDLVTIVSKVVEIEAPHIQSLGKSLAALWKVQKAASASRKAPASPKASSKSA